MSCINAKARLIKEGVTTDASLVHEDYSVSAILNGGEITAGAEIVRDEVALEASLERDDLRASARIQTEKIDIDIAITCSIGKDNSLWASDGVLYDSVSEPLFVTE